MKDNVFRDKVFLRRLIKLMLPMALQSLMLALVAAADSLMLGSQNSRFMSAVSEATQIQFIQNMVISSIVSGCSILGAQYWGKGDKETVRSLFCMTLRINFVISMVFFCLCEFMPYGLMSIMTNNENLRAIGAEYLRIAGWSYLLSGISQCYLTVMKVSEHADTSAAISITAVIVNIFLNAFLIYGIWFLPEMNHRGAALATVIARFIELALCVIFSAKKTYIRPSLKGLFRPYRFIIKDFIKCILPVLTASFIWGSGFASYTAFMGHLGEAAASANAVAAVVRDLVCCLCNGISVAASIMIGNELGAGDLDTAKLYGDRLMKLSFLCGFLSTLIMLAVTPALMTFVDMDELASKYLWQMMLVMSFYMIGRCVNTVTINGIFYSGGDIVFDIYSLIVAMWCVAVPLALIGTHNQWPVVIVYACTCIDEVGKIPWVMVHYRKYKWVKDLTRENASA